MRRSVEHCGSGFLRRSGLRIGLAVSIPLIALLALAPPISLAAEPGEAFQAKCSGCHTIGGGKSVGPDLKEVTTRRGRDWLLDYITAPDQVRAKGDPIAAENAKQYGLQMPTVGVSRADAESLLAYIDAQSGSAPKQESAPAPPSGAPATAGDAARGKDYFTGKARLQNGGPPCSACHTAAGIGRLGGGAMGPDLTSSYSKLGEQAFASVLGSLPFPTMKPIYGPRPLTPEEQADLAAFHKESAGIGRSAQPAAQMALLAGGGAAIVFLLAHLVWRDRLAGVRQRLLKID